MLRANRSNASCRVRRAWADGVCGAAIVRVGFGTARGGGTQLSAITAHSSSTSLCLYGVAKTAVTMGTGAVFRGSPMGMSFAHQAAPHARRCCRLRLAPTTLQAALRALSLTP